MTMRYEALVTPAANTSDSAGGGVQLVQGFREGSISTVDFKQRMAAAGRVFRSNHGSVVTALTFTDYTINRPQAWLRVPLGTAIMLTKFASQYMTLTGTAGMAYLVQAANDIGNGTSTAASLGPLSTRSDFPVTSNVTARHLASADTTVMTTPIELDRWAQPFAITVNGDLPGNIYNPDVKPLLIGPASVCFFIKFGTAATGFAEFEWVETPSNWWT